MSLFKGYNRDQIYEEMDGKESSAGSIISKLLSIVLLLSVGFTFGSIYSTYQNIPASNTNFENPSPLLSNDAQQNAYISLHTPVSEVAKKCADSVVEITIETQNTMYGYYTYSGTANGSGVIISADGYILTNNHVISGAKNISVALRNGTKYDATLVGKDSKTDIAIIKIDADNLTFASIGDSSKLIVGELAVAIGNPLGKLGGTVSDGIISALEREINLEGQTMNLIQTNAAINPGNSGGGLFNASGELVGIVVAKSSGYDIEGIGFAIPVNDVKVVIDDLLKHGYATNRPFLGVSLADTAYTNNNNTIFSMFFQSTSYGALVDEVVKDSPADKCGIKKGDIIISLDNQLITNSASVSSKIATMEIGDKIQIGLIREEKTLSLEATLSEYKGE